MGEDQTHHEAHEVSHFVCFNFMLFVTFVV
jgi:hypothetical protein